MRPRSAKRFKSDAPTSALHAVDHIPPKQMCLTKVHSTVGGQISITTILFLLCGLPTLCAKAKAASTGGVDTDWSIEGIAATGNVWATSQCRGPGGWVVSNAAQ